MIEMLKKVYSIVGFGPEIWFNRAIDNSWVLLHTLFQLCEILTRTRLKCMKCVFLSLEGKLQNFSLVYL